MKLKSITLAAVLGAALLALVGCSSGRVQQLSFDSPGDAVQALLYAAEVQDPAYGRSLFGPEVAELSSGDAEVDQYEKKLFALAVERRHELARQPDGSYDILVGETGFAFPVPLVEHEGRWLFDTPAGVERLTDIRVGYHELKTIQALQAIAIAQDQYYQMDRDGDAVREYAPRFLSSVGKRDGLYWPTGPDEPNSPLGFFFMEGVVPLSRSLGYNGYFYVMLTQQGPGAPGGARSFRDGAGNLADGYAVLAYPAVYDETAVMTFMMGADGIIYQKDLGPSGTREAGRRINGYDPTGWTVVDERSVADAAELPEGGAPVSAFALGR